MKALVIIKGREAAAKLCSAARKNADEVVLVVIGDTPLPGAVADKTLHIALPTGSVYDDAADTIKAIYDAETPDFVYLEATRSLKVITGKLAAHANTSAIVDVLELADDVASNRYFGGIGQRSLKATGAKIYTISVSDLPDGAASGTDLVEEASWVAPEKPLELVETRPIEKSGTDLFKAETVISVGRGFAEEAQLELAYALRDKLGAGLGCTRPLTEGVDWLPRDIYIGVTGLQLAPTTYIAIGISGQMQHMVGCNRATTLLAINKDKNAPIFKQCDVGLIGDIKEVLPALIEAL
ncbi:MAG: electron transfer flavoprotein subunit alpha/FixB family protein [Coriobacteriia bacterium]|nr:electron transfer flavoprotein subunit alpha/FixB family protein [Coriobacteriia bacterium]